MHGPALMIRQEGFGGCLRAVVDLGPLKESMFEFKTFNVGLGFGKVRSKDFCA